MSNLDEDDELQPSIENELLELNKIMKDVDASLRTKILSEVESLIAKYRKCLINAVQGKKLYQMVSIYVLMKCLFIFYYFIYLFSLKKVLCSKMCVLYIKCISLLN